MSIFAGLAQGFAQGAMAAMPAATDRYVQARRRANERKQTIEDRQKARAENLADEQRREMAGLKTSFAKLGGQGLGAGATPEMYRDAIATATIDDEYNSKRSQLQQSGIDPTNMDHNQIDEAIANLGVTTNQARENALAIQNANIESNRIKSLDGYDAYKNLERMGRANPTTMIVRDEDGKITGYNFTPMNEAFEADRKEKNAQKNSGYSYEDRKIQIEDMRERLTILQGESNAQFALDALTVYERNPTKPNFDAAFASYKDWARAPYRQKKPDSSGQQGPTTEMSSKDKKFLEQSNLTVATEKLRLREKEAEAAASMRQAMGGDVLQGYPLLSYGLKPSTGGGVQSTVAETQGTIPLGDTRNARPNLMTSMEDSSSATPSFSAGNTSGSTSIDSLGGGDDLSSLDDLTISNRALKGDEAAIQEAERRELF